MGEWSKKIGEKGEEIVEEFLDLIGWSNAQKNIQIPCTTPNKHKRPSSQGERKTHGIDFFFQYRSQLISNSLENIVISSKYTSKPYPGNPTNTFKEHFTDLAQTLEEFPKSKLRQDSVANYSGIDQTYDRGVLFWLSDDKTGSGDIVSQVSNCKLPTEYEYSEIFLVDNDRASFIYNSILYAKNLAPNCKVDFIYFNTSFNDDPRGLKNGKILPVQYLNGSILPIRVSFENSEKVTLLICVRDNFDRESFSRITGMAKSIGVNLQTQTIICFPNYNALEMENDVKAVLQSHSDDSGFSENLEVRNLNLDFRN